MNTAVMIVALMDLYINPMMTMLPVLVALDVIYKCPASTQHQV